MVTGADSFLGKLKGIVEIYPALNPLGVDSISRGIPMFDLDMNEWTHTKSRFSLLAMGTSSLAVLTLTRAWGISRRKILLA